MTPESEGDRQLQRPLGQANHGECPNIHIPRNSVDESEEWDGGSASWENAAQESLVGRKLEAGWRQFQLLFARQVTRETSSSRAGQTNIFQFFVWLATDNIGYFFVDWLCSQAADHLSYHWERGRRYPRPATSWWQGEEEGRWKPGRRSPGGTEVWGGIEIFPPKCQHFFIFTINSWAVDWRSSSRPCTSFQPGRKWEWKGVRCEEAAGIFDEMWLQWNRFHLSKPL